MVDEITSTPSSSQSKRQGPVLGESRLAKRTGLPGGLGGASQAANAGPSKPPPPSFPARRPLSSSDEEEVPRPKKKKRLIVNPERSGMATAGTRVSLVGRLAVDFASPFGMRNAPDLHRATQDARRNRRVTLDGASLGGSGPQSGSQANGNGRSGGLGSASSSRIPLPRKSSAPVPVASQTQAPDSSAPLQRARARQKSTNNPSGGAPTQNSGSSSAVVPTQSRPRHTDSVPPPHEVIEILDSDDDPPPPTQQLKASTKPPRPAVPPLRTRPDLPRTNRPKRPPLPKYKEDNHGVIILDSDDEESPAANPPHQEQDLVSTRLQSSVGSSLPAKPPCGLASTSSQPAFRTPAPSVPPVEDNSGNVPSSSKSSQAEAPAPAQPPKLTPEAEDVNMSEDSSCANDQLPVEDTNFEGLPGAPNPEPSPSSEKIPTPDDYGVATADPIDVPVDTAGAVPLPSPEDPVTSPVDEGAEVDSNSPPAEPPSRTDTSTSGTDTLLETETERPEVGSCLASISKKQYPPVLSPFMHPSPSSIDMQPGTESPVSLFLDPQLKDLAISGTSSSEPSRRVSPSVIQSSLGRAPTASFMSVASPTPKASAQPPNAKRRSPKKPLRALYGGPDGFFAAVYKASEKRYTDHGASQSSGASASLSPRATKATQEDRSVLPSQEQPTKAFEPPERSMDPTEQEVSLAGAPTRTEMLPLSPVGLELKTMNIQDPSIWAAPAKEPNHALKEITERPHQTEQLKLPRAVGDDSEEASLLASDSTTEAPTAGTPAQQPSAAVTPVQDKSSELERLSTQATPPEVTASTATEEKVLEQTSQLSRATPPVEDPPEPRTLSQIIRRTTRRHRLPLKLTANRVQSHKFLPQLLRCLLFPRLWFLPPQHHILRPNLSRRLTSLLSELSSSYTSCGRCDIFARGA
ncbi:hypothetical protein C8Q79DRAFT_723636 [Trametes meyenii]|nr:hypothetical protein C8Q79DRAFT_723636 [Trametes meyenii]